MTRMFPQQLRYDLFIGNSNITATPFLNGAVRINMDEARMAHLSFSIKDPDVHADWIRMGTKVKFWGGYFANGNPLDSRDNSNDYRMLFTGTIYKIQANQNEAGVPYATIECIDTFYSTGGYSAKQYRYPSRNNPRGWASQATIKTSEIVKKLCEELNIDCEISLGQDSDIEYTLTEAVVQDAQSDWDFLNKLATRCGCYCWTILENEKTKLFFVERSSAFAQKNKVEFVNIGRRGNQFLVDTYSGKTSVPNELHRLKDNQILLTGITTNEDPGSYGQHTYKVTDFNSETGEQKELLVNYDENSETITHYELDTALIESMNKTEEGSKELDRILGMGALSIPWEEAKKYYKEVVIPAGRLDALDGVGFLGVNVTGTSRGDLRVAPYQSYLLHGVVRGRNLQRKSNRFYLKSMSYIFDNNGFINEYEFIA